MALAAKDIKPGMTVIIHRSVSGQWEVLDKHPQRAHWWLHRWIGDKWETTYEHQDQLHRVANGSRHEYEQMELEAA